MSNMKLEIGQFSEMREISGDSAGGSKYDTFEVEEICFRYFVQPADSNIWLQLCSNDRTDYRITTAATVWYVWGNGQWLLVTEDHGKTWWRINYDEHCFIKPCENVAHYSYNPSWDGAIHYLWRQVYMRSILFDREVRPEWRITRKQFPVDIEELGAESFPSGLTRTGAVITYVNPWISCVVNEISCQTIPATAKCQTIPATDKVETKQAQRKKKRGKKAKMKS